jgi:DNA-binding LacI/PurR family transcriptional regulator
VREGFLNFCEEEGFECEVLQRASNHEVEGGQCYVVIEEADLVEIIKQAAAKNLKLGKDIGVITYNDTPFKEILAGGISVLSTDFIRMGETMAEMIQTRSRKKVKNPFKLILRNSV